MPIEPRTEAEIYNSIRSDLESSTDKMTNFVEGSFNDQFLRSYATVIRELEIKALATELSGYIDFAGREITNDDLRSLGIENVEPDEINPYMEEKQLDILARNVGTVRNEGSRAVGVAEFELTSDAISIPHGYTVATDPNSVISGLEFTVDLKGDQSQELDNTVVETPTDGSKTLTATIVATEPGEEYNLGPGSINHQPNPKPGVNSVTNIEQTAGGTDPESSAEVRNRARNALFTSAQGGTRAGIKNVILNESESGVNSVSIDEFKNVQPPYVDVIVGGGSESEILELIQQYKPVGVKHNLYRPETSELGIRSTVISDTVSDAFITDTIKSYFDGFDIGDPLFRSDLINDISVSTSNIESVPILDMYHDRVRNETHIYNDAVTTYELDFGPLGRVRDEQHYYTGSTTITPRFDGINSSSVTVEVIQDGVRTQLATDSFTVTDADGDGNNDTISIDTGVTVDQNTPINIGYNHDSWSLDSVYVKGEDEFIRSQDYVLVDNDGDGLMDSIEWQDFVTPENAERFVVDYNPYRSFTGDLNIDDRSKIISGSTNVTITEL